MFADHLLLRFLYIKQFENNEYCVYVQILYCQYNYKLNDIFK